MSGVKTAWVNGVSPQTGRPVSRPIAGELTCDRCGLIDRLKPMPEGQAVCGVCLYELTGEIGVETSEWRAPIRAGLGLAGNRIRSWRAFIDLGGYHR